MMRDQQQMTHVFVCGTDPKADGQTIVQQLPQMREAFGVTTRSLLYSIREAIKYKLWKKRRQ